jgi:hypothetical protein
MRLSFGFVRGDRIACLYHGWQFDRGGACVAIPAHPRLDVPPSIAVTRHSCREALGLIWAQFGDAIGAPVPAIELDQKLVPVRSVYLDCDADFAAERFTPAALPAFNPDLADPSCREIEREGPLVVIRSTKARASETLVAALQPIGDGFSAVHVLVTGSPGDYRGPAQLHFARVLEPWRLMVESDWPAARAHAAA